MNILRLFYGKHEAWAGKGREGWTVGTNRSKGSRWGRRKGGKMRDLGIAVWSCTTEIPNNPYSKQIQTGRENYMNAQKMWQRRGNLTDGFERNETSSKTDRENCKQYESENPEIWKSCKIDWSTHPLKHQDFRQPFSRTPAYPPQMRTPSGSWDPAQRRDNLKSQPDMASIRNQINTGLIKMKWQNITPQITNL